MGRPISTLNGTFIGQRRIVRVLERMYRGARTLGEVAVNVLLVGSSGMGKTALAMALASVYETRCHIIVASAHWSSLDIAEAVNHWQAAEIVFADELHEAPVRTREVFQRVLSERKAPKLENGRIVGECDCPAVTVIGATDQPGLLNNALLRRFAHTFRLQPYAERELIAIIGQNASKTGIVLTPQGARRLARAARGNPRRANMLLTSLRHYHAAEKPSEFTKNHVLCLLNSLGIDDHNCDRTDRAYLRVLARSNQRPQSLQNVAVSMGLDQAAVVRQIEPWVLQNGWAEIVPGGRQLTTAGHALVKNRQEVKSQ